MGRGGGREGNVSAGWGWGWVGWVGGGGVAAKAGRHGLVAGWAELGRRP